MSVSGKETTGQPGGQKSWQKSERGERIVDNTGGELSLVNIQNEVKLELTTENKWYSSSFICPDYYFYYRRFGLLRVIGFPM